MKTHLAIRTAHKTFCGANWCWDGRLQSGDIRLGYNLWYVVKGRGLLKTAEGAFELKRGDCFLLRSWEEHYGTSDRTDPVVVSWCCYDYFYDSGKRKPPENNNLLPRHRFFVESVFFEGLMDRLIEAFQTEPAGAEAVQWLQAALNEVKLQDCRVRTLQGIDLGHAEIIEQTCLSIRENPGRKLHVSQLAAKASMCVDHFIRVFKRHKGVTPCDYMVGCRVEAATGLLQFSTHNVSQIAELLGYPNVYAFSRQFKKRSGMAPTSCRGRKGNRSRTAEKEGIFLQG